MPERWPYQAGGTGESTDPPTRNGQHIITAWLRWHLADEEFRRTTDFLRQGCTFCNLGVVQYKNW